MKTLNKSFAKIFLACSLVWGTTAIAEVKMLDKNASKQQIRDAFFNQSADESDLGEENSKPKTRGIEGFSTEKQKLKISKPARVKKVTPPKKKYIKKPTKKPQKKYTKKTYRKKYPAKPKKKKTYDAGVATAIQFKYNSSELLSGSRNFIKKFGDVLSESDVKFIIEGHTDASGAEKHNFELSQQRAIKIRDIFIFDHDIAPNRIVTVGKGESLLRFAPNNYKNRRVEIKPIK